MDTSFASQPMGLSELGVENETQTVGASYDTNFSDSASAFAQSLEDVARGDSAESVSELTKALIAPLEFIDNEAAQLAEFAQSAIQSGGEMTPSEMVTLTTRSQEFMFYSQLTANVANRTADGLQQLFRQQS